MLKLRSKIVARAIHKVMGNDNFTLLDVGAGSMYIKEVLEDNYTNNFTYIPVDKEYLCKGCKVLDMNKDSDISKLPAAEVIICLGILEHLESPQTFIYKICNKLFRGKTKYIFLSYNITNNTNGRANNLTLDEFTYLLPSNYDIITKTNKMMIVQLDENCKDA